MEGKQEYCDACRKSGLTNAKECQKCEGRFPELLSENRPAWQLWLMANTQWRTSFDGLLGLDYVALHQVAETIGVEMIPAVLAKVRVLELWTLKKSKTDKRPT